jgi:hypothetical protein
MLIYIRRRVIRRFGVTYCLLLSSRVSKTCANGQQAMDGCLNKHCSKEVYECSYNSTYEFSEQKRFAIDIKH